MKKQKTPLPQKSSVPSRPPIVAILGHVDHGKTTLLDYIRSTHVAAREAGGITQKIGAYQVDFRGHPLTFIDTPGHAAFNRMRSRGAGVADIAVLVVDAGDGVMPQTIESIKHIQKAAIPFVVAINKVDKEGSNPDSVKAQLTEHQVFVEGYGGNTPFVLISGKTGLGVDSLLETILLLAELEELVSSPEVPLVAPVIEAKLDSTRGPLVSIIVREGTIKVGQDIVGGRVRALFNDLGKSIPFATPGMPVQILGFKILPAVGEIIRSVALPPEPAMAPSDDIASPAIASGDGVAPNRLNLILRADTLGSLEAIEASFTPEINIITVGTGDLTESDILHAISTQALVLGFAVRIPSSVQKLAEAEGVAVKSFTIIYELLDYLEKKVFKLMEPTIDEEELGRGVVLKTFDIDGSHIAGTRVDSGRFETGDTIHLVRSEVSKDAKIRSIRLGREEVKKVETGHECGLLFSPNLDIKEKDLIISYKKINTED